MKARLAWLLLALLPWSALAADPAHESLAPIGAIQGSALGLTVGRVDAIRAPLLIRPAFTAPGASFPAELDLPSGASDVRLWLQRGAAHCAVELRAMGAGATRAWADVPHLQVVHLDLAVGVCAPGLYDLHLRYRRGALATEERQVGAVSVLAPERFALFASGAATPRIVVIADPQVGDPRATEQAIHEGDAARLVPALDASVGSGADRWRGFREALRAAREEDPDLVLLAGDLAFGQLVPGSYAAEFEDLWQILAEAGVPLFAAPGNHDGYVSNGQDGLAYWRAYLGPTYTLAPTLPGTWLLVLNTYDWSDLDRAGVSRAVSAWGGQVRDAQLAWASGALAQLRATQPNARILALSHHSPSWRQDPFEPQVEGIALAEQVERGAVTFTSTDQGWIGENRLALRDLLRAHRVEVAFAGHTHHDRIARDDGFGNIVGTTQTLLAMPDGFDPRLLHYWTRDDAEIHLPQPVLAALLRLARGPVYVDTTTPMSDTDQYWGIRPVAFAYDEEGRLDLARLGYALTQAELDALAVHPERYNASHASLGLFSKPIQVARGAPWNALG